MSLKDAVVAFDLDGTLVEVADVAASCRRRLAQLDDGSGPAG